MATFKRFQASVGSQQSAPAPTTVYTVPSSKTSVITGMTVSNVSEFELPVDIFITVGSDDYYIAKDSNWPGEQKRLTGMEKMVLGEDDVVKSDAPVDPENTSTKTFVVWLSVYEDV